MSNITLYVHKIQIIFCSSRRYFLAVGIYFYVPYLESWKAKLNTPSKVIFIDRDIILRAIVLE
jgi:hypothetical protein